MILIIMQRWKKLWKIGALPLRGVGKLTDKDKKALMKVNATCNELANLDYIGFYIFAKKNSKQAVFEYNTRDYKVIAHFIAVILADCASSFGVTPEEFLKAVEEDFKMELS